MTTARDIMTADPTTVAPDESARRVAQFLADEDIGSVIVADDSGRIEGIVTDRDLAVGIVAKGLDPETSIRGLLSGRDVTTIGADESLERAIDLMKASAVRRLPVIHDGRVVGIISQADLATHYDDANVGDLVAAISEAPDNTNQG